MSDMYTCMCRDMYSMCNVSVSYTRHVLYVHMIVRTYDQYMYTYVILHMSHSLCNTTCDYSSHELYMSITQDGYTPLISAAWCGEYDVVIDLLDSGADVNAQRNVSHYHLSLCHS